MARKSRIEPVIIALNELLDDSIESMQQAVINENFERAEIFKMFKSRIKIVISLCEESKPKEGKIER